jgi:hypothetical protein
VRVCIWPSEHQLLGVSAAVHKSSRDPMFEQRFKRLTGFMSLPELYQALIVYG